MTRTYHNFKVRVMVFENLNIEHGFGYNVAVNHTEAHKSVQGLNLRVLKSTQVACVLTAQSRHMQHA